MADFVLDSAIESGQVLTQTTMQQIVNSRISSPLPINGVTRNYSNGVDNLGSQSNRWATLFATLLNLSNEGSSTHIFRSTSGNSYLKIDSADNGEAGIKLCENDVEKWGIVNDGDSSDTLRVSASGSSVFSLNQGGRLGVNVGTPVYNMDLFEKDTNAETVLRIGNTNSISQSNSLKIIFSMGAGTTENVNTLTLGGVLVTRVGGSNDGALQLLAKPTGGGDPVAFLKGYGANKRTEFFGDIVLSPVSGVDAAVIFKDGATTEWKFYNDSSDSDTLKINDGSLDKVFFKKNGFFGVNTSPEYLFDVFESDTNTPAIFRIGNKNTPSVSNELKLLFSLGSGVTEDTNTLSLGGILVNRVGASNDGAMTLLAKPGAGDPVPFMKGYGSSKLVEFFGDVFINPASGDPRITFKQNGTTKWKQYSDESDSSKLKFNNGTLDLLSLDQSGNLEIAGSISFAGGVDAGSSGLSIKFKEIQIGDWDMDTFVSGPDITLISGSTDCSKIKGVEVVIRPDASLPQHNYNLITADSNNAFKHGMWRIELTGSDVILKLSRRDEGSFDNSNYSTTSGYNRGWVRFWYVD